MITLLQLDYFRKLAATEHITQTARELYISQTALSSMIIGLEKELGVQLFDRSKRSIRLNEAGKLYLRYVNDMFAAMDNGRAALMELTERADRQVSVAMGTSQVWLPMVRDFRKRYPECTIKQQNKTLEGMIDALRELENDFVIASVDEITDPGLEHVFLKKDSVYLCVSQNHRLAGRESVHLKELENEAYIDLPVGTPWREYCARLFQRAGVSIRTVLECDYSLRAALIDSEFGVALTSASAYEVDMFKPNCYIPIADEFAYREMALFWNPKKYMSKTAQNFREFSAAYWTGERET